MALQTASEKITIYWLHDHRGADRPGGAQFTNEAMLEHAPDWANVVEVYPDNIDFVKWDTANLDQFVIFNNIREFSAPQISKFASLPFMIYAHDFWQYKERWQLRLFGQLIRDAIAIVYLSPLHKYHFGKSWQTYPSQVLVCPPHFDVERYHGDLPKPYSFCYLGEFGAHKGMAEIDAWGKENSTLINCYGWGDISQFEWLIDCGFIEPDTVPKILAKYYGVVFLPKDIEPFGRVSAEAILSGCTPVFNKKVGSLSYGWQTLDQWQKALTVAPDTFWQFVEGVYTTV